MILSLKLFPIKVVILFLGAAEDCRVCPVLAVKDLRSQDRLRVSSSMEMNMAVSVLAATSSYVDVYAAYQFVLILLTSYH